MFRSPSVAFFREVFNEYYITDTPKQMCKYKTLNSKCVIRNIRQNTKHRQSAARRHNTHDTTTLLGF